MADRRDSPDSGRIVRVRTADGPVVASRDFAAARPDGAHPRLPLLCLAGLSRNSRDFLPLARFFANHATTPRRVIAVDSRGRGLSDPDPDWRRYAPDVEAGDVLAVCAELGIERAVIVGTSRGGILAMLLAGMAPALVAGVVLNDIGPVIEPAALRRIKAHLSARRSHATWNETVDALKTGGRKDFPDLDEEGWRDVAEACFAESDGRVVQDVAGNFPEMVKAMETEPASDLWPIFDDLLGIPVLAIRGELTDLLSPATFDAMADRHPGLLHWRVPAEAHPPLLRDRATLERIAAFAVTCDN